MGVSVGIRPGPAGWTGRAKLWDGAKVISKEARRGGENGVGLGDKDSDGQAGRGWSRCLRVLNAAFAFLKRGLPLAFPLCLRGVFLYGGALLSLLAYSRPCLRLLTEPDSKSVLLWLSSKI